MESSSEREEDDKMPMRATSELSHRRRVAMKEIC